MIELTSVEQSVLVVVVILVVVIMMIFVSLYINSTKINKQFDETSRSNSAIIEKVIQSNINTAQIQANTSNPPAYSDIDKSGVVNPDNLTSTPGPKPRTGRKRDNTDNNV